MTITVKEFSVICEKFLQKILANEKIPSVMLWGPPGVGKSEVMADLSRKHGLKLRDIRLSQLDPVDLRGVPAVKNGQTVWAVPSFFPADKDSAGILFLDELSSADQSIQAAAYQLILDRRLGEYELPKRWMICAAGNRAEDHAISMPMPSALANRLIHFEIKPDTNSWCEWATRNNISPELVAFIRFRPECLFTLTEDCERGWPSPRSWANVSKMLKCEFSDTELRYCISGLVGANAAAEFLAYRKIYKSIGDVHAAMVDSKKTFKIQNKPDVQYAIASAMAYWVWQGKSQEETEKLMNGFITLCAKLPKSFASVALIDAMGRGSEVQVDALTAHKNFHLVESLLNGGE